jgi:rubrerythrin
MGTEKYSYEDVVDYAVLIEQRGVKLYKDAARGLKNEPARNVLLHLAEQEKQHEAYFRELKNDVHNNKNRKVELDDETVGYLGALTKSEVFPSDDKQFRERFKTLKDVIAFGMQAEKDSILFYVELSRHVWDDHSAGILQSIIREEKRHLVQLLELDRLVDERDVYY